VTNKESATVFTEHTALTVCKLLTPKVEEITMNRDEAGGNWKQFKGKMKEKWGKLTDDDMTVI